jgi:hypothetical protein
MVDLGFGEKSLDDIFDEADVEIAAAKEIEACSTGVTVGSSNSGGGGVAATLSAPRKAVFDADGNPVGFEVDMSRGGGSASGALSGQRRMVKDDAGNIIGDEPA